MSEPSFTVTAIVAIRNGAFYFNRLCEHMRQNNISLAVIDNESEDGLQKLIQQNQDVVECSTMLGYNGSFDLTKQLQAKREIASTLDSDWIIHLDADELLFSDIPHETLLDAIHRVDTLGYEAINFNEFVFLPVERLKKYNHNTFHEMRWYYFFEPRKNRLVRAFRNNLRTDIESGGHEVEGDFSLYPVSMIMRHYIFESKSHAHKKYRTRTYSQGDIDKKFHGNRLPLQNIRINFPSRKELICADKDDWILSTSQPKKQHFWEWA